MLAKVLLVDDQDSIRTGYQMILDSLPQFQVVGAVADGQVAQDWIQARLGQPEMPDIVLMDIRMPRCDGIVATRAIKALAPAVKILALTTYDQDDLAFGMLEAGAAGFLLKGLNRKQMAAALMATYQGDAVIAARITGQLLRRHLAQQKSHQNAGQVLGLLTPQESEVTKLVAEGLNNAEIADVLSIQVDSAKKAVSRILAKTGLRDRTQLAIKWHLAARGQPEDI